MRWILAPEGLTAGDLVGLGYKQISRKYRLLAKLPDGKTGIEALREAELKSDYPHPDLERWTGGLGEWHCRNHYLRCYSQAIEVDQKTFDMFRKLGGEAA